MTIGIRVVALLLATLVLSDSALAQAPGLRLREGLYLPPGGEGPSSGYWDAVDRAVAEGSFAAPKAGDTVAFPDGRSGAWRLMVVEEPGINFDVDRGGWLYFTVDSLPAGPALVDLMGHQAFYVNGLPRAGRPMAIGQMKYPVQLKEGVNDFLVHVGDGPVSIKIKHLESDEPKVHILQYDRVLPWLLDLHHVDVVASVLVVNANDEPLEDVRLATKTRFEPLTNFADYPSDAVPGVWEYMEVDSIPAMSVAKVPIRIVGPPPHKRIGRPYPVDIEVQQSADGEALGSAVINLSARNHGNHFRRTWIDGLGTVQECITIGPKPGDVSGPTGLVVAMPSVLKSPMATAYAFEEDFQAAVVVPTTRRPGLARTGMGRSQVDEAVNLVEAIHEIDENRVAVNGFADAGLDAWDLALRRPGLFSGAAVVGTEMPMQDESPLWTNGASLDLVYRHGEDDPTITEDFAGRLEQSRRGASARTQVEIMPEFDRWWGAKTISDDTMTSFLFGGDANQADGIQIDMVQDASTRPHSDQWAVIHQWIDDSRPGRVQAKIVGSQAVIRTDNVHEILLRGAPLMSAAPLQVDIDGSTLELESEAQEACLQRGDDGWRLADGCNVTGKTSLRSCYDDIYRRPLLLVYGTAGDDLSTRESWAKARYDAEQFWNIADGPSHIVADRDMTDELLTGRNVILYGNADSNVAWSKLIGESPIDVRAGSATIGDREMAGDDIVVCFVRPLAGDRAGLVAAVGTSGPTARRMAYRLPMTDPMQDLPDWMVVDRAGMAAGAVESGRFDRDWSLAGRQ
ncbi:MAG: hypothetical protein MK116_13400 [Phycisphaerales bacterium]|nr:hypothetical protein [Phycisphaerales bacterium]